MVAGTSRAIMTAIESETVFNEASQDIDFRIESDGNANMFFLDASANKIYIGDNASHTDDLLQIETPASGGGHGIQIRRNDSNTDQGIGRILFGNNTDTDLVQIHAKTDGANDNGALIFSTQPDGGSLTERVRITHDGKVGIGTASPNLKLHVEESAADAWIADFKHTHADAYGLRVDLSGTTSSIRYAFATYTGGGTGFFVRNDGTVGIGTNAPSNKLEIKADSGHLRLLGATTDTKGLSLLFDNSNNRSEIRSDQAGVNQLDLNYYALDHRFGRNAGLIYLTVTDTGNVGIGTESPAKPLHISSADNQPLRGESRDAYSGIEIKDNGSATLPPLLSALSNDFIFYGGHASTRPEIFRATAAGDVGIGQTPIANSRLTVKTQGDVTYPIRVVNSADTDMLFGVYESSDGDGNNGMLYLNDGAGNTDVKISTNGDSYFNGGKVAIGADHADEPLTVRSSAENINTCLIEVGNDLHATNTKDAWIKFVAGAATNDYSWAIGAYPTDFRFSYLGARGTAVASAANVRMQISSGGRQTYNDSSTANGHANFVGEVGSNSKAVSFEHTNGGGEVGTIVTGSSSTTYNTSSDYRLKENIDYSWDATTRLKQLKPARFNWIADDTNTLLEGFLAHEVSTVVPNAVTGGKDAMADPILYEDGDELPSGKKVGDVKKESAPAYQGIDHSKLVPLLVKTIQELEARIKTLEDA